MKKAIQVAGINVLILGLIVVVLELIFGNWLQRNPAKRLPELARQTGRTYQFKTNGLTGEDVEVNFKRDKEGLRGKSKWPENKRQILVLGGSTAIEFTVPEENTWAEQLEKGLNQTSKIDNIDVINAGIAGQTLLGNKVAVQTWLSELSSLKPELVLVYYGYNDSVYTLHETPTSQNDPDSKTQSLKETILLNSALAMLGRELKGNYKAWANDNQNLFDYRPEELPSEEALYTVNSEAQVKRVVNSPYPDKLEQLIKTIKTTWPSAKVVFIAQSDPNCFFTSHSSYRAKENSSRCEDLLSIHHYTKQHLERVNSRLKSDEQISYEPLFLDNPYDRSGASDHIHTNSRGSRGIAQKLTPRVRNHL